MGMLKNTFSWSFSAAEDFEQCRRRRYWSKYAMWGGWSPRATDEQKTAYRLCKMDNRWGLMGQAAENAIMWMLRRHQQKKSATPEEAWNAVARPFLTQKWNESKEEKWRASPKKYCCLREHYYQTLDDENQAKRQIANQIKNCLINFSKTILPRLESISPQQEFQIATPETGGDVEHFIYEGVKIYSIPDYAYRLEGKIHIHDWKAGKIKAQQHQTQLSLYALWAIVKHNAKLEDIFLYVEYLNEAQVLPFQLTPEELQTTLDFMSGSIGQMTEYLVDADREKNQPLPKEEWERTGDTQHCEQCNFKELCEREQPA
jgi:CRISPR/Cas system-associated exonuclease Cas4 (RecB family)